MAQHRKYDLLDRIIHAVTESGWNVTYLRSVDEHPFGLQIYREEQSYSLLIYVWNLTHGGGEARPASEYRIQVTGVDHFEQLPGGKTLILGWWQDLDVFSGFDVRKHLGQLGKSPSIQIREESLREAYIHGFASCDGSLGFRMASAVLGWDCQIRATFRGTIRLRH